MGGGSAAIAARLAAEGDLHGTHAPPGSGRTPAGAARSGCPTLATQARRTSQRLGDFADLLANFARRHSEFRSDGGYVQRLALDSKVRSQPLWSQVEIEWDRAGQHAARVLAQVAGVTALIGTRPLGGE